MVCAKKGQSSIEFISTYVWALVAIVLTLSGLYLFGVFDMDDNIPDSCSLGEGIGCTDVEMKRVDSATYFVDLGIVNTNDEKMGVQSIKIRKKGSDDYCESSNILARNGGSIDTEIGSFGSRKEMRFIVSDGTNCSFLTSGIDSEPGMREKLDVVLVYTKGRSTLPVTSSGSLLARLKGNETNFQAPSGACVTHSSCDSSKCGSFAPGFSNNYGVSCFEDSGCSTACTPPPPPPPPNNPPYFSGLSPTTYSFTEGDGTQTIISYVSSYGYDADNDPLIYYISNQNGAGAFDNCVLSSPSYNLSCNITNQGTGTFDIVVNDSRAEDTETITIVVSPFSGNQPPEWLSTLNTTYLYNKTGDVETLVANLSDYSNDPENDPLFFDVYSLPETNTSVASCSIVGSPAALRCFITDYGKTKFRLNVSDIEGDSDTTVINVEVYDPGTNSPPYFTSNLTIEYSYDISNGTVTLVDLSKYSEDPDGDSMNYYLKQDEIDVANCDLSGSNVVCDLKSVGRNKFGVSVDDGLINGTPQTLTLNVTNAALPPNTAPYFDNLVTDFIDSFSPREVQIANLSEKAVDDENDPLDFYLDTSKQDPAVTDCILQNHSLLTCKYLGEGLSTLGLTVSDGELNNSPIHYMNVTLKNALSVSCLSNSSCCMGTGGYSKNGVCFADNKCTKNECVYSLTMNFDNTPSYFSVPLEVSNLIDDLRQACNDGYILSIYNDDGAGIYYNSSAGKCIDDGLSGFELLEGYEAKLGSMLTFDLKGTTKKFPEKTKLLKSKQNLFSIPLNLPKGIPIDDIFLPYITLIENITDDTGLIYEPSTKAAGTSGGDLKIFESGKAYSIYVNADLEVDMSSYIN